MTEPKFKKGDKVKIVKFKYLKGNKAQAFNIGDVLIIKNYRAGTFGFGYNVNESNDYFFYEDELELISTKTMTITAEIPLDDKKKAHRIVNNLVDSTYYAEKLRKENEHRWTPDEIERAKQLCVDMVSDVVRSGGDVLWDLENASSNSILCTVWSGIAASIHSKGTSAPHHSDEFNIWIGKCVSFCKALHKPIPDFIKNKNQED